MTLNELNQPNDSANVEYFCYVVAKDRVSNKDRIVAQFRCQQHALKEQLERAFWVSTKYIYAQYNFLNPDDIDPVVFAHQDLPEWKEQDIEDWANNEGEYKEEGGWIDEFRFAPVESYDNIAVYQMAKHSSYDVKAYVRIGDWPYSVTASVRQARDAVEKSIGSHVAAQASQAIDKAKGKK